MMLIGIKTKHKKNSQFASTVLDSDRAVTAQKHVAGIMADNSTKSSAQWQTPSN